MKFAVLATESLTIRLEIILLGLDCFCKRFLSLSFEKRT